MKKILFVLSILVLMIGCKPKEVIKYVPLHDTTKISVTKIEKDTVIDYKIQYQNVVVSDTSFLSTDLAFSRASIDSNGLLHHSIQNYGKIGSKIVYVDKVKEVVKEKPVEVEKIVEVEKKLNWFQKLIMGVGGITIIFWIIWLLKKFI